KEKRNRKRIPVQKKPESIKSAHPGGAKSGERHSGGRPDKRSGKRPEKHAPKTQQQQEIDAKSIQDKIRQTQAKLAGATRNKSLKAKYRRNKREEMAEKRASENSEQQNLIQVTEFISV